MKLSREEILRKILHVFSATLIPAGIIYLPGIPGATPSMPAVILGIISLLSVIVEIVRFRYPRFQRIFLLFAGSMMRPEEDRKMTGATSVFISAFLCTVIFIKQPFIAGMALCMFVLGDAAAALVGLSIGRIRLGKKSLEGSLACFAVCLLLVFAVFPHVPLLLEEWGNRMPAGIGFAAALSTTLFELVPIRISKRIVLNDNLVVPILTGLVMSLLNHFAAGCAG